jgi:hypothetical protein
MLKIDWYLDQPLDFEYKNYVLLDYIQSLDKSYQLHQLSPYLLWTEKLVIELKNFEFKRQLFLKRVEKDVLLYEHGKIQMVKSKIKEPEFLKTINDIIDFSQPILESKISLGYKLLEKYPQILF